MDGIIFLVLVIFFFALVSSSAIAPFLWEQAEEINEGEQRDERA